MWKITWKVKYEEWLQQEFDDSCCVAALLGYTHEWLYTWMITHVNVSYPRSSHLVNYCFLNCPHKKNKEKSHFSPMENHSMWWQPHQDAWQEPQKAPVFPQGGSRKPASMSILMLKGLCWPDLSSVPGFFLQIVLDFSGSVFKNHSFTSYFNTLFT